MRLVFMGSPDFAVPSLQALIESSHDVVAVFSQPPRPSGRGQKVTLTPVHALAQAHNIPVYTPEKSRDPLFDEVLGTLKPDAICVAAYGMLLRKNVLDAAPCINVHPSALPRWRGAAPLHYTVLNGDTTTDMCIMQMEEGLDSGPVYARQRVDVGANETTGDLHDRMAVLGGRMLVDVLDQWPVTPVAQPEEGMTYAHKFKPEALKDLRHIDWEKSNHDVHNHIRGLSPWPGATFELNGDTVKVYRSELEDARGPAGHVLRADAHGIVVACGEGAVKLTLLQRPGKKAMNAGDFLAGCPLREGQHLL